MPAPRSMRIWITVRCAGGIPSERVRRPWAWWRRAPHPAKAGVQLALLDVLLAHGASVDGLAGGWNPLIAALHNGRGEAAARLAKARARMDLEGAAGVGRLDLVRSFFSKDGRLMANATQAQVEAGLMWSCEYGHASVVKFLLGHGANIRAQPHGETGLHWAAYNGHARIVKLLLQRKAPVDVQDQRFRGTPLGWALYGWCERPGLGAERNGYYEVVTLSSRPGRPSTRNGWKRPTGSSQSVKRCAPTAACARRCLVGEFRSSGVQEFGSLGVWSLGVLEFAFEVRCSRSRFWAPRSESLLRGRNRSVRRSAFRFRPEFKSSPSRFDVLR